MKRIIPLLMTIFLAGMFGLPTVQAQQQQQPQLSHTFLKVGDAAPDFTLRSDQGTTVKLSDFRGKKTVILAFYVLAFTGGWTKELQGYQAGIDSGKIDLNDTAVLGISIDAPPSNAAFAEKIGVKFPLLSDMKREVTKAYGILNEEAQFASRTTFVVDKQGKIQHVQEGSGAIDPTNAIDICTDLHKKEPGGAKWVATNRDPVANLLQQVRDKRMKSSLVRKYSHASKLARSTVLAPGRVG